MRYELKRKGEKYERNKDKFFRGGVILLALTLSVGLAIGWRGIRSSKLAEPAIQAMDGVLQSGDSGQTGNDQPDQTVDLDDPLLTLVNPTHALPKDWQPDLVDIGGGKQIDRRAYADLMAMIDAAEAEGCDPLICSAYRTREKQEQLYANKLQRCLAQGLSQADAEKEAAFWVAKPDTSEHQLGLAVDIVSWANQRLDDSQLETSTQQWLMAHCWEYGFILRYTQDKMDVTQVGYEPWHYRYVGRTAAGQIYDLGVCFEEYLELLAEPK